MNENVENNKETIEERNARLKKIGFQPGQSGNPGGRPRNPLKEFSRKEFESWNDRKKRQYLKKVTAIDRWKMTEGNPDDNLKLDAEVTAKIISIDE